jgi:hypothetical protein
VPKLRIASLYGVGVWLCLVLVSLVLLPLEDASEPLHESLKSAALVGITLMLMTRYLGRAGVAPSALEGLAVGAGWAVVAVVLDLALYLSGAFNIGLRTYFLDVASSYLVIPVCTGLLTAFASRALLRPSSLDDRCG